MMTTMILILLAFAILSYAMDVVTKILKIVAIKTMEESLRQYFTKQNAWRNKTNYNLEMWKQEVLNQLVTLNNECTGALNQVWKELDKWKRVEFLSIEEFRIEFLKNVSGGKSNVTNSEVITDKFIPLLSVESCEVVINEIPAEFAKALLQMKPVNMKVEGDLVDFDKRVEGFCKFINWCVEEGLIELGCISQPTLYLTNEDKTKFEIRFQPLSSYSPEELIKAQDHFKNREPRQEYDLKEKLGEVFYGAFKKELNGLKDEEQFTWEGLKEFVNSLPEDLLQEPVRWWGVEIGGTVKSVSPLEDDYARGDEYLEPVTEFLSQYEGKELEEKKSEIVIVAKKGVPILWVG